MDTNELREIMVSLDANPAITFGELRELVMGLDCMLSIEPVPVNADNAAWPLAAFVRRLQALGDILWTDAGGSPYGSPYR